MKSPGKIRRARKWLLLFLFITCSSISMLFAFPQLLFSEKFIYKNCTVYSDSKIDRNIKSVLDSALEKIKESELFKPKIYFKIFLCNDLWRYSFYSLGHPDAGGITHTRLTGNIFIRPCKVKDNTIIAPDTWKFARPPYTLADRPLSYFIAHEMTHRLQLYQYGKAYFKIPKWIIEGYADYVAKGDNFDYTSNLHLWKQKAPELKPESGLYRFYHLLIYYLLNIKHLSIRNIIEEIPSVRQVEMRMVESSNQ